MGRKKKEKGRSHKLELLTDDDLYQATALDRSRYQFNETANRLLRVYYLGRAQLQVLLARRAEIEHRLELLEAELVAVDAQVRAVESAVQEDRARQDLEKRWVDAVRAHAAHKPSEAQWAYWISRRREPRELGVQRALELAHGAGAPQLDPSHLLRPATARGHNGH